MEGAKIKSFGGTESDLDALKEEVRKAAEAGKKILIYDEETGQVVEIPAEVMLDWIDSSGGGENASDTAVISIDKDGNILYDGWSDKKAFSDIGTLDPTSAKTPNAKAISVAIVVGGRRGVLLAIPALNLIPLIASRTSSLAISPEYGPEDPKGVIEVITK